MRFKLTILQKPPLFLIILRPTPSKRNTWTQPLYPAETFKIMPYNPTTSWTLILKTVISQPMPFIKNILRVPLLLMNELLTTQSPALKVPPNAILGLHISDNAIISRHISPNAILERHISDIAIDGSKINNCNHISKYCT